MNIEYIMMLVLFFTLLFLYEYSSQGMAFKLRLVVVAGQSSETVLLAAHCTTNSAVIIKLKGKNYFQYNFYCCFKLLPL